MLRGGQEICCVWCLNANEGVVNRHILLETLVVYMHQAEGDKIPMTEVEGSIIGFIIMVHNLYVRQNLLNGLLG